MIKYLVRLNSQNLTIVLTLFFTFLLSSCTTIAENDSNNFAPTIEILSPQNYSTFISGDLISLEVTANDNDGNINSVKFYLDSIFLAEDSSSPFEYSFTVDSVDLSLGLHFLSAVALDDDGEESIESYSYFVLNSSSFSDNFIVINEISYNPPFDYFSGDWVEFYNNGIETVNVSGWLFKDRDSTHSFVFPDSSIIAPAGFLVIVNEIDKFSSAFPNVTNVILEEEFNFGLSTNGELISLSNSENDVIDILEYSISSPWPTGPNGTGPSLELINPSLSNPIGSNWAASIDCYGTPGERNSVFEE